MAALRAAPAVPSGTTGQEVTPAGDELTWPREFQDNGTKVDILINNLGVYEPRPFEEISDADWHRIIETNFMSGVRLSRQYLPRMKAANWGRIIFISSESS
jgi:NAD(P)-dependent dehydrogenase (short-subunit alcohol dehydrogenase family)